MQAYNEIIISAATADDAVRIFEIETESFGKDSWSRKMIEDACSESFGGVIKAECDGKICGFLIYTVLGGDEINIDDIAVAPENRKNGIADAMMRNIFEMSEKTGMKKIMLEVRESNLPAINLYEKYHLKKDGIRKNYYREPVENAVLMSVDITE